jgi:hypothetical protein
MEKIEYRYRFWYRYRPKFMVSDWYRIETKKAVSPITKSKTTHIMLSNAECIFCKLLSPIRKGLYAKS